MTGSNRGQPVRGQFGAANLRGVRNWYKAIIPALNGREPLLPLVGIALRPKSASVPIDRCGECQPCGTWDASKCAVAASSEMTSAYLA